jgi:stage II sporulation protein P
MKKVWLKRGMILFFVFIFLMLFFIYLEADRRKEDFKQSCVEEVQQVVKMVMIELIPGADYEEYDNMELIYRNTKNMIENWIILSLGYQEQYGNRSKDLISENTVPSFLYQEEEETEDGKEAETKVTFTKKQLYSQSFLRKKFIQVDSTTTITNQELNGKTLFLKDLSLESTKSPQILIYHTHGSEEYADSKSGVQEDTVVGVGEELEKQLKKYGYSVLHDTTSYDVRNGKLDRSKAYYYAAQGIEKNLKKYPQIQVIIDLHRDGVGKNTRLVTKIDGKDTAQIMFFNGMSRTATNGNIAYLKNPYKEWNLALSLQMQKAAYEIYPGFTRKIYIKGYRYNLHYRKRSMLVEVGAQTNTVAEAKRAMKPLADIISEVLK